MNYSVFFKYEAYARCKCCGARTMEFSSASLQDARLKAIQSWNTRKPMQEICERLEEYASIWCEYNEGMSKDEIVESVLKQAKEQCIRIVKEVGGMNV